MHCWTIGVIFTPQYPCTPNEETKINKRIEPDDQTTIDQTTATDDQTTATDNPKHPDGPNERIDPKHPDSPNKRIDPKHPDGPNERINQNNQINSIASDTSIYTRTYIKHYRNITRKLNTEHFNNVWIEYDC